MTTLDSGVVRYIVVHCSATPPSMDIGVAEIDRWHRQRGFLKIGYHRVIRRDGTVEEGRAWDEVGAHVEGWNSVSVGICLVGGIDDKGKPEDNFEPVQKVVLRAMLESLLVKFPKAQIIGHHDLNPHKACPSFDVKAWWAKENAA